MEDIEGQNKSIQRASLARSIFPGYALYKFHANRPKSASQTSEKKGEASVAEFLSREAKVDDNFSLNVVLTSLNAENELELRKFLARRLSKGTTYAGSGHISGLELSVESEDPNAGSSLCFYTLLRHDDTNPEDTGASDVIPEVGNLYTSSEFVLCLLTGHEVALDLFRPELNSFSCKLLELLDSDMSSIEAVVWPSLEGWYEEVTEYLTRCVATLQEALKYVIYAALMDSKLVVTGCDDEKLKQDILRFMSVCSLSELLESQPDSDPESGSDSNSAAPLAAVPLVDLGLPLLDNTQTITLAQKDDGTWTATPPSCSEFCDAWAGVLVSGDEGNPEIIRNVIDTYKLKTIQDMNTLKRHLRQAEADFYDLFRCHVFLRSCGNSTVLLRHVASEASGSASSRDVLRVLNDLMHQPPASAS